MDHPAIVRIESQKVERYEMLKQGVDGYNTIICNVGICRDGKRWEYYTKHHTDRRGYTWMGMGYAYLQLS